MNTSEAREFVNNANWVYAKSYSETYPHEYTTRDRVGDDKLFEAFILFARENAILKNFYSKQYLYFELDGFEYWKIGRPTKAVVVLNRAPINDQKSYRGIAPEPEAKELLLKKLKARDEYLAFLHSKNRSPLEAKQFEFLMNSERKSPNILDHSQKELRYV